MEKLEDTLTVFDKYQGQVISWVDAETIQNTQQEIIKNTFSRGLKLSKPNHMVYKLIHYLQKVDAGYFLKYPETFQHEQYALFQRIHRSSLPDTDKIFFEYLLGLSRLMLSIQLLHGYVQYICAPFLTPERFICESIYSLDVFYNRMRAFSSIGITLISTLSDYYFQENSYPEQYWTDVQQYFMQHKQLDVLARNLASMHYVPQNKRFLAMMQSLHWQGFGGSGNILSEYEQLKGLGIHAIFFETVL